MLKYMKLSEIIHNNYREISQRVTEDLQRWNTLPISLQERISVVKMNILPRLNCLSFMIPISPPPKFLEQTQSLISKFIWNST